MQEGSRNSSSNRTIVVWGRISTALDIAQNFRKSTPASRFQCYLSDKQEGRQTLVSVFFSTSSQHPCAGHLAPALAVIVRIHIGSSDREKTRESRGKKERYNKKTRKIDCSFDFTIRPGRRDFRQNKTGGSTLNFISGYHKGRPKQCTTTSQLDDANAMI